MKYLPHDYQKYATGFIEEHNCSLLFLTMGLGKTIITLSAIQDLMFDSFDVGKVLVIAPLRVARDVWPDEVKKWDEMNELQMSVVVGDARARKKALQAKADIYVINRENLKWLVEWFEAVHQPWPFDMIVIDELSSFKNHKSQRFRALRKVRPFTKRVTALTGTPASNGLMDLWAEVHAVDGGKRLGRFIGQYREEYFRPDRMNPMNGMVYSYSLIPGSEERIYNKINDITISMKAKDYLHMPDAVSVSHEVDIDEDERSLYDAMRKDLVMEVDNEVVDAANAAVLTGKLLQLANGAIYSETGGVIPIHDRKLDMLSDLVEQANGQSVLIAYWFKHDYDRIKKRLTEEGYEVHDLKSSKDLTDWNAGKIPIALISPASAGHGLNIQAGGHILIWYSMVWSLEMYQQTNARLWRQGQKEVVTIHHIVCRNTIDGEVLDALEHKDVTQQKLIAAVKAKLF